MIIYIKIELINWIYVWPHTFLCHTLSGIQLNFSGRALTLLSLIVKSSRCDLNSSLSLILVSRILCLKKGKLYRVKSVRIWSFSGPYFSAFELNTDQKTPNADTFHAVLVLKRCKYFICLCSIDKVFQICIHKFVYFLRELITWSVLVLLTKR